MQKHFLWYYVMVILWLCYGYPMVSTATYPTRGFKKAYVQVGNAKKCEGTCVYQKKVVPLRRKCDYSA